MIVFIIGFVLGLSGGVVLTILLVRRLGRAARRSLFWEGVLRCFTGMGAPRVYRIEPEKVEEEPKPVEKPKATAVDHEKAITEVLRLEMGFTAAETRDALSRINETCSPEDTLEHKIFEGLTWLGNRRIATRQSGLVVAKY